MKYFHKLVALAAIFLFIAPCVWAKITIYMCGDSTMQDWGTGYYPKHGMGQDFGYFFDAGYVSVYNGGCGGTTSLTYYKGCWSSNFVNKQTGVSTSGIREMLQKGDYVFIMFGANDNGYKVGEDSFNYYMTAMVNEARARGAYPILLTPIRRGNYTSADSVYESYHAYPIYTRNLSVTTGAPLIDLDTLSRNLLLDVGEAYDHEFFQMYFAAGEYSGWTSAGTDNQHMQQMGANAMGRMVTEQIREHAVDSLRLLADYLKPMYQVDVKVSPEGADSMTTISSYYPEGMTVTLKTIAKTSGALFKGWYDGSGNLVSANSETTVSANYIKTFVMGKASMQYTAVYANGSAEKYTGTGAAVDFSGLTVNSSSSAALIALSSSSKAESSSSEHEPMVFKSIFDATYPDSANAGYSETAHTGYWGKGYWNFNNDMNTFAEYYLTSTSAGYATLGVIYSNGGTANRTTNAYIGDHDYYMDFPPTASWDVWDTAFFDVDLFYGDGSLKFISMTSDGGPNISAFGFNIATVYKKGEAPETLIPGTSFSESTLRFSNGVLYSPVAGIADIRIFRLDGTCAYKGRMMLSNGGNAWNMPSPLKSGVYEVVVNVNGVVKAYSFKISIG
ncbi:MAG: GDSL-type esterase/lipase family protein [Fibrobacteraceae bacterium]|nr:GDSL-type esterase/lipase family protein [Fibrobacteraceae bacterium]